MVGLSNVRRSHLKTLKARCADGSIVDIDVIRVTGEDPTATGTIHRVRQTIDFYRLATGESVDVYEDGTAWVSATNETLTLLP